MQTAIDRAGSGSIVAELSNGLARLGADTEQDGTRDGAAIKADIRTAAMHLDLAKVRANLEKRYLDLGEAVSAAPRPGPS